MPTERGKLRKVSHFGMAVAVVNERPGAPGLHATEVRPRDGLMPSFSSASWFPFCDPYLLPWFDSPLVELYGKMALSGFISMKIKGLLHFFRPSDAGASFVMSETAGRAYRSGP